MRLATTGFLPRTKFFFFAWHSEFNSALFQSCIRRQALARKFAWTFFFSFRLVFNSSFGFKHCMVPRDLAFRAWEKLSTTPAFSCQFGGNFASGFYPLLLLLLCHYCSYYFILFIWFPSTWNSRQFLLASYRIGSTDDMMAHTNTDRRLLHFTGIFHTNGNGNENSVALYDNPQELNDKAKARIVGVNSGVMLEANVM